MSQVCDCKGNDVMVCIAHPESRPSYCQLNVAPPAMTDDEGLIAAVINARGYLVVACAVRHKIGDVIKRLVCDDGKFKLNSPLYVIAETNRADMDAQNAFVASLPNAPPIAPEATALPYFYRLLCD